MLSSADIARLAHSQRNAEDYKQFVLRPIMERLGIPDAPAARRWEFIIEVEGFGQRREDKERKADCLIIAGRRAMLCVEDKPKAAEFDVALGQARAFCRNFRPKDPADRRVLGERAVPYALVAAGERVQMFRLEPLEDGITVDLRPIEGFLTFEELEQAGARAPGRVRGQPAESNVLALSQFRQNFEKMVRLLSPKIRASQFKFKAATHRDLPVFVLNEVLVRAAHGKARDGIYKRYRLPVRLRARLEEILGQYDLPRLRGPDLAYAYRDFVTGNYTGKGFGWGKDAQEVGRYLTPGTVVRFMIRLAEVSRTDRIVDFACGSGGFLGAAVSHVGQGPDARQFLATHVAACDIDMFSVSTAQCFLDLLLPGPDAETLPVFHHNGLFSDDVHSWEPDLRRSFPAGAFDVVISNPPAGARYLHGHDGVIRKRFDLERDGHVLQNPRLFIQRAIQLARPQGRICLVVPDGILANEQTRDLRALVYGQCQVLASISLPRVFPNVSSKMSILYMKKAPRPDPRRDIFMAAVQTLDPGSGRPRDLDEELQAIWGGWEAFRRES